ncbi:sodium/hydrogen exchanger 9B2 isoform X2 [Folsomia candida]|uniref:sodium/hydrogen exchanger 9B2 isoform X2 n=1 Tax=Folsomia candida TaxID=158441 RepID=UPI001605021C|nr:sodium/hydrogen exchanger 9B2 isoform X2 [Folsomia candida]
MSGINLKPFQTEAQPNVFSNTIDLEEESSQPQQSRLTTDLSTSTKTKNSGTTMASSNTTYQSIPINPPVSTDKPESKFTRYIKTFSLPPIIFDSFMSMVTSLLVWLSVYTIVGADNLPGGIVFVIVFLEFGGRITGYFASLCHLPPMVGMLGLGIVIRNVPYIDFGKYLPSTVASPIRQLSLAVILTRAGLGLDLDVLLKFKWLVARLAFFPTVVEASVVGILVHFIIGFPWLWSLIVGFSIAAVSPAVIVPRILILKEQGYGVEKGIPTIILAAASLDNIVAIALFGVCIGFTFSTKSLALTILQGPLEILLGCCTGLMWGAFTGIVFPSSVESGQNWDNTVFKLLMVLGGSVASVLGYNKLGYSGAGVLSCLISSFTTACFWKKRGAVSDFETIRWMFTFLWKFFEPLLFGVIGCQIVVETLDKNVVVLGIGCLVVGSVVRFGTTFIMVTKSGLSLKERIFFSIAWTPKATVQAAIGPMALDLAQKSGNIDDENLGLQVLTLAVLVILLTAPLGELAVIMAGPRLLSKPLQVMQEDIIVGRMSNQDQQNVCN